MLHFNKTNFTNKPYCNNIQRKYLHSCSASTKPFNKYRHVNEDYNENMLYIFYVGYFKKELIFHYGTSTDIIKTEFQLYKDGFRNILMKSYVVDYHVYMKEELEKHIISIGLSRTIPGLSDTFTLANNYNIAYVTSVLDKIL